MKTVVRINRVCSDSDLAKAFAVRVRVFVNEQGVPAEIETDRDDARAYHLLAFANGRPVGTARIVMRGSAAKIGRMAVLKDYRRQGIGSQLLKRAIRTVRQRGAQTVYLNAQVTAIGFYERAGFRCAGRVFKEAGIPHRKMVLDRFKPRA